jgi:hypothetical protein
MPLAYQIDRMKGLITITGDYAHADEWAALFDSLVQDPDLRLKLNFIRDLRGVEPRANVETAGRAISIVREFWDRLDIQRAAAVTDDEIYKVGYALGLCQDRRYRVFTSYDDALAWLQEGRNGAGRQHARTAMTRYAAAAAPDRSTESITRPSGGPAYDAPYRPHPLPLARGSTRTRFLA